VSTEGAQPIARLALVLKGDPRDPRSWSGVPSKLATALEEIGCEVVAINAEVPRARTVRHRFKMSWADQEASCAFAATSSLVARGKLAAAGAVDGVLSLDSGYTVRGRAPVVSFDDMTVAQALRQEDDPVYQGLGSRSAARWQARQQRNYARSHACCAAARWAADSIREDYDVPESKVHVVGFGHNVEMERRERDWSVPRFLFVGGDWRRKRGGAIVEAFKAVREEYPEATLDLVGGHPLIDAPGINGHGKLPLGSESGERIYHDLLRRSTCFVMPSSFEPLGIAYLDAATAGMPSIATTSGGARDAIDGSGLLVDPGNDAALQRAMLRLCDPETARAMGDRAREHSDLYTWRAVAERVLRSFDLPAVENDRLADYIA
jgi:glycosyltransferase involved in cell wall biosynthesis